MEDKPNRYELLENVYYLSMGDKGKWIVDKDKDYITGIRFRCEDYGEIVYHLFETDLDVGEDNVFPTLLIAQYACDARNRKGQKNV